MPLFTCPRCGRDYLVPLAFCEAFLEDTPMQTREGSECVYVLTCQECETHSQILPSSPPSKDPEGRLSRIATVPQPSVTDHPAAPSVGEDQSGDRTTMLPPRPW